MKTEAERAAALKAGELRAYGLTHGDIEQIKTEQAHGQVKMVPANNAEEINDKYFAEKYTGYLIPWHETMHYHIAMEARLFDTASGSKLSESQVQIFPIEAYKHNMDMKPTNGFAGYVTHILHNPTLIANKAVKSTVTPIDAEYAHIKDGKQAKELYRELTGNEPARAWSMTKTIEKIKEFKAAQ